MNIIANNCVGADLYFNVLKTEFMSPFIWSLTYPDEFIYLCKNYDSINFNNIDLIQMKEENDIGTEKHKIDKCIFGVRIDNKITTWFTHILYDSKCKEPTIIGDDRFYYRNFDWVFDKYNERLKRMTEPPVFTVLAYQKQCWTKEYIERLESNYPIYVLTDIQNCKSIENKHIEYVKHLCGHPWIDFNPVVDSWKNFLGIK